ncbi:MAG: S46 family peptidase [Pseudomonadota bacterium]|nr:S46 family peptidase [Pseudomonadota bacterium]
MRRLALAALLAAFVLPAQAGEGMWTFDGFPAQRINRELGTRVDQAWLDRVRAGAVKLGGCSASLVSAEGLILTNNHCVDTCKQQLSTPERNYGTTGFLPASRAEEKRCPGMTAEFLTGIEDVTARVLKAMGSQTGQARVRARDAEIAAIETAGCGADPKLRCQVVDLYRGGQFKLYRFRKYDDVRLAFAPEDAIANFGGDPDNFSFPRFSLDAAFVRIYENDQPARRPGHLPWNASRPTAGAPVFVVGNPGSTQRLQSLDQLRTTEEVVLPIDQLTRSELRGRLINFAEQSPENAFIAGDTLYGVENSYKRARGQMRALTDAEFMAGKGRAEAELRARVKADAKLRRELGDPWADLAAVQDDYRELYPAYHFLELRAGGGSSLYGWARSIVRGAQERAKPNGERLPEFTESRLPATQRAVLEARPVYPALDELELSWWLSKTREFLTVDDPQVKRLLGRESPEALAERLVAGTRLGDPAERRRLWEGGLAAVQASDDPLIRFVLASQADARAVRSAWDERVVGPTDRAAERIARARFAVYGDSVYPDATGTLRITYGRIEGWTYDGRTVAPFTTFAGLNERATGAAPFVLPERWRSHRADPATVFNMAVSTDTIGGSSGSPAINAAGEVIGANFDSTFLTQRNAFGYDPKVNRSVIVTAEAITEALRDIYGQDRLVRELTGR